MKSREEILSDHFEKWYGFRPDEKQLRGFKYVFAAMEEYAGQDFEGYKPKEFAPDDPENPRLLNHHHIPFYNGWITWRGPDKPSSVQKKAIHKVFSLATQLEKQRNQARKLIKNK